MKWALGNAKSQSPLCEAAAAKNVAYWPEADKEA
jgi:hypothetical protein